jgi:threonylcarbamoyladenosine tRNA methylthiotransferase MtaB
MRRRYSTAEYERAVAMAEDALPDLAVTTDVMVGFPGESEEEFAQSLRFCERMSFSGLHIFPYSPRPGTAAANMPDQVDERVKKVRGEAMLELAQKSAQTFRRRFLGRRLTVLWEGSKNGIWSGLTNNYLRVFAQSEEKLSNRLLPATLVEERGQGLWGSLAKGA